MSNPLITLPVRRPILTIVIYLVVLVTGLFSLSRLPIDLMPEITLPTITVVTGYSNAGPREVEQLVTRPIEGALAGIQGIEEIVSTSSEGSSTVRVSFVWGTDLDEAVNDMRDRIDRILGRLPAEAERPFIRKFDLSAFPVMILGVVSDMDLLRVRQIVEDQVQYRLERVNGVASVDLRGGTRREIQVALSSSALEAFGVSSDMVVNALRQENRNVPAGSVEQGSREVIVRTLAEYENIDDVRNTIITVRNGAVVRVADVAEVRDGFEESTSVIRINGVPGVQLAVSKQSGTNTVAVAKGVHRELERINRDIPEIELLPIMDTSEYVERSIQAVAYSLMLGGIIAILVLLLFMRNISTTLIIATAIPICIIATFALVYYSGLTLNMMTFGGLALGIGMLLDNAIVVLDNIYHKRENGEESFDSAVRGGAEVWSAVTASTLTTLAVFFPVMFIRGMSGVMFQSLALVVAFSLACSLLVALTLVPMLSSKFMSTSDLSQSKIKPLSGMFLVSKRSLLWVESKYRIIINWALAHRFTVVLTVAVLLVLSVLLIPYVGMELMPSADESEVRVNVTMETGTRLEVTAQTVREIEKIIESEVPEAQFMLSRTGGGRGGWGGSNSNTANLRVALVPRGERRRSTTQIADQLRGSLTGIPGAIIRVREGQGLFILRVGQGGGESISLEVRGHDLQTGQGLAQQLAVIAEGIDGITDAEVSREAGRPEYRVRIDRPKAADLGLSAAQIGTAVQTAMGGSRATQIRVDGFEYDVRVRLAEDERRDLEKMSRMTILNNAGVPVSLQSVSEIERGTGPVQVERRDRERVVSVMLNHTGRDLGSVANDLRLAIRDIELPEGFSVLIRGDYEEQQRAYRELMTAILIAVLLVFLVMAGQFESFKDPFIVLFSIPVALTGIVAVMILTGTPFSVQAFIGCIILTGIVVNNAIVLVDTVNRYRRVDGMELFEALRSAGQRRLRPILMTTLTTAMGLFPLSLGLGEGGEAQAPMARVVIGGLLASTVITLVLIPVVYSFVEERRSAKKRITKAG
ncbi:acriflavin resistance protein [Chitinispirillum alkaliphilum]|nr:acriflavin resistance protein [Chitinispirillum alkaliphilum]